MASNDPVLIRASDDPGFIMAMAQEFLLSQPVTNNLILSLLEARLAHSEPGRYWLATRSGAIAGVAFQSPLTYPAQLTAMESDAAAAMADAIADSGVSLPGIGGEAVQRHASPGNGPSGASPVPFRSPGCGFTSWVN
jgi:hypothetical protein